MDICGGACYNAGMTNKRICGVLAALCLFCTVLWAKTGDKMYVNVREAALKSGTGFFASETGSLAYGSQVRILSEKGKWVQVASSADDSVKGWLPLSSLTKKKILLDDSGLFSVSASADELALAGKGFSAAVEDLYADETTQAAYDFLDEMEGRNLDKDELLRFITEGGLSGGEE